MTLAALRAEHDAFERVQVLALQLLRMRSDTYSDDTPLSFSDLAAKRKVMSEELHAARLELFAAHEASKDAIGMGKE